jgi:hypothetical protein
VERREGGKDRLIGSIGLIGRGKIRFAATFGAYIAYTYQGETGWRIPIADFLTIIVSDVEKIYIICNTGSGFSIDR